jgi:NhaP-type Na+/H+ or K+/H+ antiporter
MLVVLFRALKDGAGFDGTILTALMTMGVLAAVGLVIGAIAEATIEESVRKRMQAELDALPVGNQPQPTN